MLAIDEWVCALTAMRTGSANEPDVARAVTRDGERGEVRSRTTLYEAAAGVRREPGEVGEEAQRLVLGVHRARRLQPGDPAHRRCGHDHVEEQGRLGGCSRDEREEARAVARDDRRGDHVAKLLHHDLGVVAASADEARCARVEIIGLEPVVEGDGIEAQAFVGVLGHRARDARRQFVVAMHHAHGTAERVARRVRRSGQCC